MKFHPDGSWSYVSEATLNVRGQGPFNHHDVNRLMRVAEAKPNPWMQILAAKKDQPSG